MCVMGGVASSNRTNEICLCGYNVDNALTYFRCMFVVGSRPGAIIAACWATMVYHGESGYIQTTKEIIDVARYIKQK